MYKNKKILGLITARAKSKRLESKNTLNLVGKPLFQWTVDQASLSKYLDYVVISTDDKKIINYTKKLPKILTFKRSKKLSKNKTKSADVILNFIESSKIDFNIVCLLQPTSPLRKYYDVDKSIKKMIDKKAKSLVSVSFKKGNKKNQIKLKNGFFQKFQRENITNKYFVNGAIYLSDVNFFKKKKTFFTSNTISYLMPSSRSVDIDTKKDFDLAKKLLKK